MDGFFEAESNLIENSQVDNEDQDNEKDKDRIKPEKIEDKGIEVRFADDSSSTNQVVVFDHVVKAMSYN